MLYSISILTFVHNISDVSYLLYYAKLLFKNRKRPKFLKRHEMARMFNCQDRAGQFSVSSGEIWEQLYDYAYNFVERGTFCPTGQRAGV